jgi:hypothetical protein
MVPLFVSSDGHLGLPGSGVSSRYRCCLRWRRMRGRLTLPTRPLRRGFQQPHQPRTGALCCSVADCRPTSFRQGPDGYEGLIDDKWDVAPALWVRVPQDKILDETTNPTGT